jgi:hypothetical protein
MAVPKPILPLPNTFNISYFIEIGVTNFLINYENMCKDYNIEKRERIRRYSRYCTKHIIITVKGLIAFIEPD